MIGVQLICLEMIYVTPLQKQNLARHYFACKMATTEIHFADIT